MTLAPRLRILFITPWYPSTDAPVEGIFIEDLVRAVALNHDVQVLHVAAGSSRGDLAEVDRGNVPTIPVWRVRRSGSGRGSFMAEIAASVRTFRRLKRDFSPHVMHAHVHNAAFIAVILGKLFRIPVVISEHASTFSRLNPVPPPRNALRQARFAWPRAARVLAVSEALRHSMLDLVPTLEATTIAETVDTHVFHPGAEREMCLNRLVSVAVLTPNKGIDLLLMAVARLQHDYNLQCTLDLVGDGYARPSLEQLSRDLSLQEVVTFHGLLSPVQTAEVIQRSDVFVLPSLYETFCRALAEAISCGKPVVSTLCGGPEDFVTDEVGVLVPVGDVQRLSEAVFDCLQNLSRYDPQRLHSYIESKFSLEVIGKLLGKVYESALPQRHKRLRRSKGGSNV